MMKAVMHRRHELELHSFQHIEPVNKLVYQMTTAWFRQSSRDPVPNTWCQSMSSTTVLNH